MQLCVCLSASSCNIEVELSGPHMTLDCEAELLVTWELEQKASNRLRQRPLISFDKGARTDLITKFKEAAVFQTNRH